MPHLRIFLGLAGCYRRLLTRFAEISSALHPATSKHVKFYISSEMRIVSWTLKQKLTTPPFLALPDFDVPFVADTDSS